MFVFAWAMTLLHLILALLISSWFSSVLFRNRFSDIFFFVFVLFWQPRSSHLHFPFGIASSADSNKIFQKLEWKSSILSFSILYDESHMIIMSFEIVANLLDHNYIWVFFLLLGLDYQVFHKPTVCNWLPFSPQKNGECALKPPAISHCPLWILTVRSHSWDYYRS